MGLNTVASIATIRQLEKAVLTCMYIVQSIHNRVKFSGDYCDYKATRKGSLNIHVQSIHYGVKFSDEY